MPAPCGGCPPCCSSCIFAGTGESIEHGDHVEVVVPKNNYGCIRPDGGAVVKVNDTLGMMRGGTFHPVTAEGRNFLAITGNLLSHHC